MKRKTTLLMMGVCIWIPGYSARAAELFAFTNPYTCVREARSSTEGEGLQRVRLADCVSRARSLFEAVRVLTASGFDTDPIQARQIERAENRGDRQAASEMLRDMVLAAR